MDIKVSSMIKKIFSQVVWHPILFALYSVLTLFSYNLGEIVFDSTIRSFIIVIVLSLMVLCVYKLIVKDWRRAGLFATWSLIIFLTYGHFYNFLKGLPLDVSFVRHRYLVPLWMILFLMGHFLLIKKLKDPELMTVVFNVISLILILFSMFSLGKYAYMKAKAKRTYRVDYGSLSMEIELPKNPPDIYYILLDGYSRADVLETKFGFDNSEFVQQLEEIGFFVADCSRSNYIHTQLTLATLFNMAYLEEIVGEIEDKSAIENVPLESLTKNNAVMSTLEQVGYETVAFETSYYWSHFYEADYYFEPSHQALADSSLNGFEELYIDTTLLSPLFDWQKFLSIKAIQAPDFPREKHFIRINFVLDTLKKLPEMAGPQFTFAHMVIPHPPYIFTEDGLISDINMYSEDYTRGEKGKEGYLNNIRFINQEILLVVEELLNQSNTEPIIIIQSDHGSDFCDRTLNFSAFYFPNGGDEMLYDTITPVNTFRLVFNYYFNSNLDVLPDLSYTTGGDGYYDFIAVDDPFRNCQDSNH
jgi:hypothetical protein